MLLGVAGREMGDGHAQGGEDEDDKMYERWAEQGGRKSGQKVNRVQGSMRRKTSAGTDERRLSKCWRNEEREDKTCEKVRKRRR